MYEGNEKVNIVLAGGAERGLYEVGTLRAIEEFFGRERIECISSTSIGSLVGYAFSCGKLDEFVRIWKEIETAKAGRFLMTLARDSFTVSKMRGLIEADDEMQIPLYTTLWNFTDRKTEYLPLMSIEPEMRGEYLHAAVNIPVFNKGIRLNKKIYFDGGFIDNIPVFPFVEKPPVHVIAVYFDNKTNYFENDEFNRRVTKLCNYPPPRRMCGQFFFDPSTADERIAYGYDYAMKRLHEAFDGRTTEEVYAFNELDGIGKGVRRRITTDTLLSNLNKMTALVGKRKVL